MIIEHFAFRWSRLWAVGCAAGVVSMFTALLTPFPTTAQAPLVGTASVIDGDTLEIHGARVRLHGIDAPESGQECRRSNSIIWRCGQQAALALSDHIGRSLVTCKPLGQDRYGRIIATCALAAGELNRWMVANGWAVAYRRYSMDYVVDEDKARQARVGIWAGQFDMPWDWRAGRR